MLAGDGSVSPNYRGSSSSTEVFEIVRPSGGAIFASRIFRVPQQTLCFVAKTGCADASWIQRNAPRCCSQPINRRAEIGGGDISSNPGFSCSSFCSRSTAPGCAQIHQRHTIVVTMVNPVRGEALGFQAFYVRHGPPFPRRSGVADIT